MSQCVKSQILRTLGRVQVLDRSFLPNFVFGKDDTIVVLGQDGLVANTVKYSTQQTIIGVNPDPERWDGVLLPFRVGDLAKIVTEVLSGKRPIKEVTMAKAQLNTSQVLYAVNDLFIGVKSHGSARYVIEIDSRREQHSSIGKIAKAKPLLLASLMPEAGVIFSDGVENDYLEFNSGTRATIMVAEKKGYLAV